MPEIIFKHTLLNGDLGCRIEVLHTAPAAHAEMRTARRYTIARGYFDAQGPRQLIARFAALAGVLDALTRQCTYDQNRFPVEPGNTPPFMIE
jgi:hypothetical protein